MSIINISNSTNSNKLGVEGIDKVKEELDALISALTPGGMIGYLEKVKKNIIISCGLDDECIEIIPSHEENGLASISIRNIKDFECFKRTYIETVNKFPSMIQDILLKILEKIEENKNSG